MNEPPLHDSASTHPDQSDEARRIAGETLADLLACAPDINSGAGPSTDPEEWFRAERESLLHWAEVRGKLLSLAQYGRLIEGFKELEGGLEHQVFWMRKNPAGRLLKITKPPYFGLWWHLRVYVKNLIWSNELFDDDIRLEGVLHRSDDVSLVISQPYIIGTSPTEEQIGEWFTLQACEPFGPHKWKYPDGTIVADVHPRNIILSDGDMFPIDLHVECFRGQHLLG